MRKRKTVYTEGYIRNYVHEDIGQQVHTPKRKELNGSEQYHGRLKTRRIMRNRRPISSGELMIN